MSMSRGSLEASKMEIYWRIVFDPLFYSKEEAEKRMQELGNETGYAFYVEEIELEEFDLTQQKMVGMRTTTIKTKKNGGGNMMKNPRIKIVCSDETHRWTCNAASIDMAWKLFMKHCEDKHKAELWEVK